MSLGIELGFSSSAIDVTCERRKVDLFLRAFLFFSFLMSNDMCGIYKVLFSSLYSIEEDSSRQVRWLIEE